MFVALAEVPESAVVMAAGAVVFVVVLAGAPEEFVAAVLAEVVGIPNFHSGSKGRR